MSMIVRPNSPPAPPAAFPNRARVAAAVALCTLGLAGPGRAAEPAPPEPDPGSLGAGSILVRGRVVGSIPVNQHSRVEPIGGRVVTPARALPDLEATYFLTGHLALAGQAGIVSTPTSIRGSYVGNLPIGDTWSASLTAAAQFHIPLEGGFKPYLGAGIGYTIPFAYEPAKPFVTVMRADPQLGPMLQAGVDYHLGGRWYANLEFKQIFLPPLVSRIGPGSATVKLDMMIVGAGLGYRF